MGQSEESIVIGFSWIPVVVLGPGELLMRRMNAAYLLNFNSKLFPTLISAQSTVENPKKIKHYAEALASAQIVTFTKYV